MSTYYAPTGGVASWTAANWATSSNQGSGSSGPPTASDDVVLDQYGGNVTISATAVCRSLNCTGYTHLLSHGAFTLTIGTSTAQASNVALKFSTGMTYTPSNATTSLITFASSYTTNPQTVDYAGKNHASQTFSGTANYVFTNASSVTGQFTTPLGAASTITQTAGTLNFNGLNFTTGLFVTSGATARTLTMGSSQITLSGTSTGWTYTGSNLTVTANTASLYFTGATPLLAGNGINWQGLDVFVGGPAGTFSITGANTFEHFGVQNLASTKTISFPNGATTTFTDLVWFYGNRTNYLTINSTSSGITATISVPSGNYNSYGCSFKDVTITGAISFQAPPDAYVSNTTGITYTPSIQQNYYMDPGAGNDATTATPLGWWSVAYTRTPQVNNVGIPAVGDTFTGGTSGKTATLTWINPVEWYFGSGTLYFSTKSGAFQAETLTDNATSTTCTIASDFTYCPWKTFTSGALAARIGPNDVIKVLKSPSPTSVGSFTWPSSPMPATVAITSSTSASPIVVTATNHGLVAGDWVQITGHTVNTNANGMWYVSGSNLTSNTFQLTTYNNANSVGNGTGGATGTCQKATAKVLQSTQSVCLTIDEGESAWTAQNSAVVTWTSANTDAKSYGGCNKIACSDSPATGTLQAYFATGNLNLSSYNAITFWVKNSAATLGTHWVIKLCSDVAGATPQNSFLLPAIPSTTQWVPLTIAYGGALYNGIQSIALYTGTVVPTALSSLIIDDVNACSATGLNLTSLLATDSTETANGTQLWPIQAIIGSPSSNQVILDAHVNAISKNGMGYYGTASGSLTTYAWSGYNVGMASLATTVVSATNKAGALVTNPSMNAVPVPVYYSGGWTTSNVQTGTTLFDGKNGNGYMINPSVSYLSLDGFSGARFFYAFYTSVAASVNFLQISNCKSATACTIGIAATGTGGFAYKALKFVNLYANSCNTGGILTQANETLGGYRQGSCCLGYGVQVSGRSKIDQIDAYQNATYGIQLSCPENVVYFANTASNRSAGVYCNQYSGKNYLRNATISDTVPYLGQADGCNHVLECWSPTGTSNVTYMDGGTITAVSSPVRGTDTISWAFNPLSTRTTQYPMELLVAEVAVAASTAVTASVWVNLSHATNLSASLFSPNQQLTGMDSGSGVLANLENVAAASTGWQQLKLTFTPTQAGVVEFWLKAWYLAGNASSYFADFSVSQS